MLKKLKNSLHKLNFLLFSPWCIRCTKKRRQKHWIMEYTRPHSRMHSNQELNWKWLKIQLKILTLRWAHKSVDEDFDDERAKVLNFNKHLMVFFLIFNSWYEAVCMLQVVELKLYVSIVFLSLPRRLPLNCFWYLLLRFASTKNIAKSLMGCEKQL